MAKLVLAMFVSLDGYIEAPGGEFVPPAWSAEFERHWPNESLGRARHLVYGRTNFIFNRDFWTQAETDPDSQAAGISHSAIMNKLPKTVVSRTLTGDPGWRGTLVKDDLAGAMTRLKASVTGGDVYAFGGAGLANSLMADDLIDEYRLMVTPELFGGGKRLFEDGRPRLPLTCIETTPIDTGAVVLHYRRDRAT